VYNKPVGHKFLKHWVIPPALAAAVVLISSCGGRQERQSQTAVRIVGCGVDREVSLVSGQTMYLSDLLKKVEPIPTKADAVLVKHAGEPPSLTQYTLSQATNTNANLGARRPIFAGDLVCFVSGVTNR
jgi:hypothetical protein